ncbi:hypothetical protein [Modicisalibacter coralii]|uniref:hypothetical protein n=1 Tax=Modicisalibacter coralii TaxID=2304602 RepID=UPI00100ACD8F|nr:hypothetical protein [Halomonas coralii]
MSRINAAWSAIKDWRNNEFLHCAFVWALVAFSWNVMESGPAKTGIDVAAFLIALYCFVRMWRRQRSSPDAKL